jgi:hypothetical protein
MLSLIAVCETLSDVAGGLDLRRRELNLSNLALDDASGLQTGYSSKIFCGMKRLGDVSLPSMLGALGCRLVLVSDDSWVPNVTARYAGHSPRSFARLPMLLPPADRVLMALPAPRSEAPAGPLIEILPPLR